MPEPFFYTGPEGTVPALRDARNLPVGVVRPGDIREFETVPGPSWVPVAGNEDHLGHLAAQRETPAPEPAPEDRTEDETPPGPQPAAPAVIAQPGTPDAGEPGMTPQEG